MREVVIVGAGLTGLAAAWELEQRGAPYRLIEVKRRLGGSAGSISLSGFTLDGGPSLLDADGDYRFLDLLGLPDALVSSDSVPGKRLFRAGIQSLVDALSTRLTQPIMRRMAVSSVGPLGDRRFGVCLENGIMLEAAALVITAPALHAEHMLRSLHPEAAYLLADYRYDGIARVHLGYHSDDVPPLPPAPPDNYPITGWHWTRHPHRVPDDHMLIEVGVRLPVEDDVPPDLPLQLAAAMHWPLNPVVQHVQYWPTAHPLSCRYPDHEQRMATIERLLPPTVALVGSDYRAQRLDQRIAQGRAAAQVVHAALMSGR